MEYDEFYNLMLDYKLMGEKDLKDDYELFPEEKKG